MSQGKNLRAAGDRIEGLLQELGTVADPRIRAKAEELVRLLMELYGSALARILEIVDDTGSANEIFDRLAADDLVASLLVLHGLHPLNVETRIARALDRVRPYLGSHGGDVKLLGVKEGVVHLRLEGSCHGCPSSTVTMKLAIEKAIEEAAPEVVRIEVEGASPSTTTASNGNGAFPKSNPTADEDLEINSGEWIALDKLPEFTAGNLALTKLARDEYSFVQDRRDLLRLSGLLPVLWLDAGRKRSRGEPINLFLLRAALRLALCRAMFGHGRASSGATASARREGWHEDRGGDGDSQRSSRFHVQRSRYGAR